MNPFFVLFAALFFSSSAFAYQSSCTAEIVSERGVTLATFIEYDFSYQQACWQAERSCEDELWQRQRRGQNPFATCQVIGSFPPPPPPRRAECNVDLYNGRHMLVTSFWAQGFNYQEACNEAFNRCYDEQRWRQDLGSYCRERFASPPTPPAPGPRPGPRPPTPRPPQQVLQSCSVNRLEMNNRVAQIHQAQAYGRTQNEAKAQACQEAMRNCQRARTGRQVCQQGR